jgi:RNA polymerase sigma factor (sigma-70 family)
MIDRPEFTELMRLVRQGDGESLRILLDEYGEAIEREIRFALLDAKLRNVVGESDVFQSVVLRFFRGLRDGRFSIDGPDDLVRLLRGIVRVRTAELVRFWHAERRDVSRNAPLASDQSGPIPDGAASAWEVLETVELARTACQRLSERDRQILQWREDGLTWPEIAGRLHAVSAESVRKQHERALAKIARQLGESSA